MLLSIGSAFADLITVIENSSDLNCAAKTLLSQAEHEAFLGNCRFSRDFIQSVQIQQRNLYSSVVLIYPCLVDPQPVPESLTLLELLAVENECYLDRRLAFARFAACHNRGHEAWLHVSASELLSPPNKLHEEFGQQTRARVMSFNAAIGTRRSDREAAKPFYAELWAKKQELVDELALARSLFHAGDMEAVEECVRKAYQSDEIVAIGELFLASLCEQPEDLAMREERLRIGIEKKRDNSVKVCLGLEHWPIRHNHAEEALSVIELVEAPVDINPDLDFVTGPAYRIAKRFEKAEPLLKPHQNTPSTLRSDVSSHQCRWKGPMKDGSVELCRSRRRTPGVFQTSKTPSQRWAGCSTSWVMYGPPNQSLTARCPTLAVRVTRNVTFQNSDRTSAILLKPLPISSQLPQSTYIQTIHPLSLITNTTAR
ncbi:hypothetical protein [Crateriforma spongiae]|uniref:hypothetical protein n=1 Tax=Crateriforma spongiae TaxID=2724528 RepID=UPI0014481F12|nr:hypothetical protein [Crateriforma spongiae]